MARDEKDYMTNESLNQRVTSYITQGGRPEYQKATEHPKTLAVYNEPYAKQNGSPLGTFEFYKDDDGTFTKGLALTSIRDPFMQVYDGFSKTAHFQSPKVKVQDNKVVISASREVLDSPMVQQLKKEVQTLKGANLSNPEVQNAIEKLNEEIEHNAADFMVQESFGWTPEQFKDYQYTVQTVQTSNPLKSSNKIKGMTKDGKIVEKTPAEWTEYYKEVYNADERTEKFYESLQSSDPYQRTMAMVMSEGHNKPVYGYKPEEYANHAWERYSHTINQLPVGLYRTIVTDDNVHRVESLSKELKLDSKALRGLSVDSNEKFEEKKKEISGKDWSQLSDEDKAFVLTVGVTKENSMLREMERKVFNDKNAQNLENMSNDNSYVSRTAIESILRDSSYDKFKKLHDDYEYWQKWDEPNIANEERLNRNATWAGSELFGADWWGRVGGTIARIIAEDVLVSAVTGGKVKMSNLSNQFGNRIVRTLSKIGVNPTSSAGQRAIRFTANLVGTVPEDLLQTSVDNILTNHAEENKNLFDLNAMSENMRNNFLIMLGFNALKAGVNTVRTTTMLKEAAKKLDLDTEIDVNKVIVDADDINRAVKKGGSIEVDADGVKLYDPETGTRPLDGITPDQGRMIQRSLFDVDAEAPKADADSPAGKVDADTPTTKIEIDTPEGRRTVDVQDYTFKDVGEALSTKVQATPAGIKQWHTRALEAVMRPFKSHIDTFHDKFGDVRVSDFDWVWYNTKRGLSPSQIIGTVDPTTGRVVTQNMIDAMQWWSKQPFTRDLRKASLEALGKGDDFDTLGYLPHTVYDPTNMSLHEAMGRTGTLWQRATGKSVLDTNGNYKGFGGDFESRYKTFASNMLWDAKRADIATAKMVEEAELDGNSVTPEVAEKAVKAERKILETVDESSSTKNFEKNLENDSDFDTKEWDRIHKEAEQNAKTAGLGKAYHEGLADIYSGYNTAKVVSQRRGFVNGMTQLSDFLKRTVIRIDGKDWSLYDHGGADLVYAGQNAIEIVNRYTREGGNFRQMLIDFIVDHSHRDPKYAEVVADKWLARIGEIPGTLKKGDVIDSLQKSMKGEAWSRVKKWLVCADYDGKLKDPSSSADKGYKGFNKSTKNNIDRFLFNHAQVDSLSSNKSIATRLADGLSLLTKYRYKALFYGNVKNAMLQVSELNRFFYTFKWGDVGSMAKRLATDQEFRARVDDYVDAVAPQTDRLKSELYGQYGKLADNAEVDDTSVTFKEKVKGKAKDLEGAIDDIGLAPINAAEAFKNRMMVAGLVSEADRLGLSGNEALRHIRNRFERVALAGDEMGRIGLAASPIARPFLFLQNFQIREIGMNIYNIIDELDAADTGLKKVYNVSKYITKLLGAKVGNALIMARLGYPSNQALGLDPFGLTEDNRYLDREDMEGWDFLFDSPLFAGGMTSMAADIYFMARKAYEESHTESISDEAEEKIRGTWGLATPEELTSGGYWTEFALNFVPGSTMVRRTVQMADLVNRGWAVSSTGNKMYTAPDDPLDALMGLLFGRGATRSAQQYNQTYGDNLLQTLGRFLPGRGFGEFDPIDDKNYSDWFKGNADDAQQFNKGYYYFQEEKNRILDSYEQAINNRYATDEEIAEARNKMNQSLQELFSKVERFVAAYERKNGSITPNMMKQVLRILNTNRRVATDTPEEAKDRSLRAYNNALRTYTDLDMSPVGSYTGPTDSNPDKEVEYQGSPQFRSAVQGYKGRADEVVDVLKLADLKLQPIREDLKDLVSEAYEREDYDMLELLQKEYMEEFDKQVAPIVALYGIDIFGNAGVQAQMRGMLSTGTQTHSGNLIPSEQYKKNKKGYFQSMPYQSVDIGKWAKKRYESDYFKNQKYSRSATPTTDIKEIQSLNAGGKKQQALAKAWQLKVRVDNGSTTLSDSQYKWLTEFINK